MPLTRSQFLRLLTMGGTCAALTSRQLLSSPKPSMSPALAPVAERPNFLVILADDMGFADIGSYGAEIPTPNLDALAARGVRFSQAYNYARCCPSRAALLTGLHPHRAGVGHMVQDGGTSSYRGYLGPECPTVAESLRAAGYATWMAGKWHVGGNVLAHRPETWRPGSDRQPGPLDRGFDRFYGTLCGAGSFYLPPTLMDQNQFVTSVSEDYYYTDELGHRAAAFATEAKAAGKPFFGYLAFTAPHWPLHAPADEVARFRGRYREGWTKLRQHRHETLKAQGILSAKWAISPADAGVENWREHSTQRRDWEDNRMAVYAAMISRMDAAIGEVVAALKANGQYENTVVMFLSDNGGCAEFLRESGGHVERYGLPMRDGRPTPVGDRPDLAPGPEASFMAVGRSWANASNSPFRFYKKWIHEGGIATPLIISGPGVEPAAQGSIQHEPVTLLDLAPTILELARSKSLREIRGHSAPALDGESLVSLLAGHRGWRRGKPLIWEHEGNRAIRIGQWKLVAEHHGPWELYDMVNDRTELHDVANSHPGLARSLSAQWDDWSASLGVIGWDELRRIVYG